MVCMHLRVQIRCCRKLGTSGEIYSASSCHSFRRQPITVTLKDPSTASKGEGLPFHSMLNPPPPQLFALLHLRVFGNNVMHLLRNNNLQLSYPFPSFDVSIFVEWVIRPYGSTSLSFSVRGNK
jgi:hypothetical protein